MENKMENEMETGIIYGSFVFGHWRVGLKV